MSLSLHNFQLQMGKPGVQEELASCLECIVEIDRATGALYHESA